MRWLLLACAFAAAVSGMLHIQGYTFTHSNVLISAPEVYALLDRSLLHADFCLEEQQTSPVRGVVNGLVALTARWGAGNVPNAYLFWFVLSVGSYLLGLGAIGRFLGGRVAGALLAFLGVAATKATIGMTEIIHPDRHLEPAMPAMAIAIWGVYLCLRERWVFAYALFGIASLFQFLVGLHPGLLIFPILLLRAFRARDPKLVLKPLIPFALCLAAIYVPMRLSSSSAGLTDERFVFLWAHVRNPHHAVPSAWPRGDWFELGFFTIGGVLAILAARTLTPPVRAILFSIIGGTWLALIACYVAVDVHPIAFITKLQLARTTNYNKLAILIAIAVLAAECVQRKRSELSVLLVLALLEPFRAWFLPLVAFAAFQTRFSDDALPTWARRTNAAMAAIGVLYYLTFDGRDFVRTAGAFESLVQARLVQGALLLLLIAGPFVIDAVLEARSDRRGWVFATASALLALFVLWAVSEPLGFVAPYVKPMVTRMDARAPQERLARRLRDVTSPDALVLVPPSFESFQYYSRRAAVVTFKCVPLSDRGLGEWGDRMSAVLGQPVSTSTSWRGDLDGPYFRRSGAELADVARRYGANYVLTRQTMPANEPGRMLISEGEWAVYAL